MPSTPRDEPRFVIPEETIHTSGRPSGDDAALRAVRPATARAEGSPTEAGRRDGDDPGSASRAAPARRDPPGSHAFVWLLATLLIVDIVIVSVIVAAMTGGSSASAPAGGGSGSAPPWLLVPTMIALPALFVWLTMRLLWTPVIRRFPAQPAAPDAQRRLFQSAWLGRFGGMNNCLIVESDDRWIHLRFMPPFSWLAPGTASIPRDRLGPMERPRFAPMMLRGRIDGFRVQLPQWAVDRAVEAARSERPAASGPTAQTPNWATSQTTSQRTSQTTGPAPGPASGQTRGPGPARQ
ncbi:MAG TPA: hypothetical protein PKC43_05590 [Phycisphaerales bacterium]|nr:hypothetical protein [Phycisphaerales bacterium]HMP36904.1 hypothetical protein [Phycisphaerales bacterium]